MPGLNGLEVTRQVRQRCAHTRVAVLSVIADEPYVAEALRNGASAYVLKGSQGTELARAVREATAGRQYLGPPLSKRALEMRRPKTDATAPDPYDMLTAREREVLQLAAEAYTSPNIAERLNISKRTAETHRARVMKKLALHTQTDLVLYALRRGIISKNG